MSCLQRHYSCPLSISRSVLPFRVLKTQSLCLQQVSYPLSPLQRTSSKVDPFFLLLNFHLLLMAFCPLNLLLLVWIVFFLAVYLGSQSNFPSDICNLYPVLAEPRSILFFQHLLWSVNLSVCFGFSCLLLKGHISPFDTWVCIFHLYLMTALRCSWVLQSRLTVFLKPRVWRRCGILVLEIWNNGTVGVVNNFKKYICEDEVLRPITFWKK